MQFNKKNKDLITRIVKNDEDLDNKFNKKNENVYKFFD